MADTADASVSVDAKLADITKILDTFLKKLSLPAYGVNNEIEKYFVYNEQDLSKLSAEQCGEIAVLITREAYFIQREHNIISAKVLWAEESLRYSISDTLSNYGGQYVPLEQKKIAAIKENNYATDLYKCIVQLKVKLTSLDYLGASLNKHADAFKELSQTKRSRS